MNRVRLVNPARKVLLGAQVYSALGTRKTRLAQSAHFRMVGPSKATEVARYKATVGTGGVTIKLMTLGLMAGTGWFAMKLHERGRMPWQHNEAVMELLKRRSE